MSQTEVTLRSDSENSKTDSGPDADEKLSEKVVTHRTLPQNHKRRLFRFPQTDGKVRCIRTHLLALQSLKRLPSTDQVDGC